jgi:GT2 family glycosyltransferase
MEIKLSIIYVLYQNSDELLASIGSLQGKIKNDETEIIVVINDGSRLDIESSCITKIIKSDENLGFARACNLGAREACGEILWFLNPDTEIISDNLEKILNVFKEDDQTGIIGSQLITKNGDIQEWSTGLQPSLWDLIRNNLGFPVSRKIWERNTVQETEWVSGTSLFMRRELFKKAGGFDENFFMYFEDIDLCIRTRSLGNKVIYFPEFKIKHLGGKSFNDNKLQKKYYYASQDYYFEKHLGKFQKNIIKVLRNIFS